jgi:hypothetical protein
MSDNEQLGKFYLGRKHDLASRETSAEPLLYDSKDLTTHAVCVGMTGSGKTGLCVTLLEEAALDGVPAIVIDPKGDLGNLLLTFPELTGEEFRPWIDESAAARKGMSADEFAASQAELWRTGLAKWGEGPERIRRYQDSVERTIYTPGSSAGIPLTILKSFAAPPPEIVANGWRRRRRVFWRYWASTPIRSAVASIFFFRTYSIRRGAPDAISTSHNSSAKSSSRRSTRSASWISRHFSPAANARSSR